MGWIPLIGIGNTMWRRGGGSAAPDAPTNLAATVYDDDRIDLTWDAVTGADSYKVYYGTDGVTFGSSTTSATNSKSVTGLAEGTLYYFYATAIKGSLESAASNTDSEITYTAEYITYVTGLVTPLSAGQATKLNTFIANLKSRLGITNLSDVFDILYVLGGETEESSLKNLVKNAHHCTNVSSTSFTALEGFTGDGIADYLNTNYKPKSQGVNHVLNSASLGVYVRNDISINAVDMGCRKGASDDRTYIQSDNANNFYVYINTDLATGGGVANTESVGMFIGSRTASNSTGHYKNSIPSPAKTLASGDLPDYNMYILALNTADTAGSFSTHQISFAFAGKGFNAGEISIITNTFEEYMDSNSKGVLEATLGIKEPVGYCWFTREKGLYNATANKTWIGLVHYDSTGMTQHILTINNATGDVSNTKIGSIYQIEDHNEPSILIRASDNRLFTCYTEHSLNKDIKYKISTNPLDASSWGVEGVYTTGQNVSYPSCFQASNGDIYIFYREVYAIGWCYIKSTDGGATFGGRVNFYNGIDVNAYPGYIIGSQSPINPNIIHFLVNTGHPELNTATTSIYAFYFDCSTDKFYKLDGTDTTANKPFDAASDLTAVMVNTLPDVGWVEDIIVDSSGYPRYLITFMPNARNDNYLTKDLYYAEWNGASVTTPHKIHTALSGYVGEQALVGIYSYAPNACFYKSNPNVIIGSKDTAGVNELYKITRVAADNFTSEAITTGSTYDKWRPFTVNNSSNNLFYLNKKYYYSYLLNYQTLGMTTIP